MKQGLFDDVPMAKKPSTTKKAGLFDDVPMAKPTPASEFGPTWLLKQAQKATSGIPRPAQPSQSGQSVGGGLGRAALTPNAPIDLVKAVFNPTGGDAFAARARGQEEKQQLLQQGLDAYAGMERDSGGVLSLSPKVLAKREAQHRAEWKAQYGYDPKDEPIRYITDQAAKYGQDVTEALSKVTAPVDNLMYRLKGEPVPGTYEPIIDPTKTKPAPGPLGTALGTLASLPGDMAADAAILVHPQASAKDRAGAAVNLYLKAGAPGAARAIASLRNGGPLVTREIEQVFLQDGFSKPEAKEAAQAVHQLYNHITQTGETPPGFWDGFKKITRERKVNIAQNMSEWLQGRGTAIEAEPKALPGSGIPTTEPVAPAKQPLKGYAVNEAGQIVKAPALESTTLGNRAYAAPVVSPEATPKNFQTAKGEVLKPSPLDTQAVLSQADIKGIFDDVPMAKADAAKSVKQPPPAFTTDETGKVVKSPEPAKPPTPKAEISALPEDAPRKRGVALDGTVFSGKGISQKALTHDAQMALKGQTIQGAEGPEKVLDVTYDPDQHLYTYKVQGPGDTKPRVHSNIYWQSKPPKPLRQSDSQPIADKPAAKAIEPKGAPDAFKGLPTDQPPIGKLTKNRLREVTWKGEQRQFNDDFEANLYDSLVKEGRQQIRDLQTKSQQANSAFERKRLSEMIGIETRNLNEDVDKFWNWSSERKTKDLNRQLDEQYLQAVAKDDFAETSKLRPMAHQETVQAIKNEDEADVVKRIKRTISRNRGGWTRLPVGDLHEIINGLTTLAGKAINAGKKYSTWSLDVARSLGKGVGPFIKRAWNKASQALKRYRSMSVKNSKVIDPHMPKMPDIPDHLGGHPAPKAVKRTLQDMWMEGMWTQDWPAIKATKRLEEVLGKNLQNSDLDLRMAINEQTRLSPLIDDRIQRGLKLDGKRVSIGIPEMLKGMRKDGIDVDSWAAYRQAMRENELASRGGIDTSRLEKNLDYIDKYLDAVDLEALKKWDAEWQKLADAHLKLQEEYGLRAPGWADKIRQENQWYFPMDENPTSVGFTMRRINPSRLASPNAKNIRAIGGGQYRDPFVAMMGKIERTIQDGEQNKSMLPYMVEASKHPELHDIVKEITKKSDEVFEPGLEDIEDPFDTKGIVADLPTGKIKHEEGADAVITFWDKGKPRTFEIDPYVWDVIRGMQPQAWNMVFEAINVFRQVPRFFTTGLGNPIFQFIKNPLLDYRHANLLHGITPADWFKALYDNTGKTIHYYESIENKVSFGKGTYRDVYRYADKYGTMKRSKFDEEARKWNVKVFENAWDAYKEMAEHVENATRTAVYKKRKVYYLKKGHAEADAARRAGQDAADIMNFGEAGAIGRAATKLGANYASVSNQAVMAEARAYARNVKEGGVKDRIRYAARRLKLILAGLVIYKIYENDSEYQKLPNYIKYQSLVMRTGLLYGKPHEGSFIAFPVPAEMGLWYLALPQITAKRMEGSSSKPIQEEATDFLQGLADAYVPPLTPNWLNAIGQQRYYMNTGGVVDMRFGSQNRFPIPQGASDAQKAKNAYAQFELQMDTLFGSSARLMTKEAVYLIDKNKAKKYRRVMDPPNPLQRLAPRTDSTLRKGEKATN